MIFLGDNSELQLLFWALDKISLALNNLIKWLKFDLIESQKLKIYHQNYQRLNVNISQLIFHVEWETNQDKNEFKAWI